MDTTPLHGIIHGHRPTVYVYIYIYVYIYVYAIGTYTNIMIYVSTTAMPKCHLGTRHLSDASAIICIGIFALLRISNLIQLNFSNSARLSFSDLIQLPMHALYF